MIVPPPPAPCVGLRRDSEDNKKMVVLVSNRFCIRYYIYIYTTSNDMFGYVSSNNEHEASGWHNEHEKASGWPAYVYRYRQ